MIIYTAKTNEKLAQITAELVSPYANKLDEKCFVFCEDKNSLMLETAIAQKTGGSFNVCVNSFSRYISTRINSAKTLSKSASSLAVYNIISTLNKSLSRIRLNASPKLSENIYRLIAQLKSAKVKPSDLAPVIENENGAFSTKLNDIYKIYAEYENYLAQNDLLDSNNFFSLIPSLVKFDKSLHGAKVVFSGFSSVTRQIMDILQAIDGVADCDFVLLKGEGEFYTNEIYDRVLSVFPKAETRRYEGEYLTESLQIEKWLFNPLLSEKDGLYSDKVHIFESVTQRQEITNIAKRIRYEVVNNGKRYKDFALAMQNLAEYNEIIIDVFNSFDIPVYVDIKNTMEKHPLIRLALSVLEVARQNYLQSAALNLCAERLFATQEEYNAMEKYINANAIGRRAFKKPFSTDYLGVDVESVRNRVINACEKFKNLKTAREFVAVTKELIYSDEVVNRVSFLTGELEKYGFSEKASLSEQVLKNIDKVFFEIENIVGDKPMNITQFKTMFSVAVSSCEVSILPLFSDVVYVGDFKSVRQKETKILFAVGLYGEVPKAKMDTALLTDRDLIKMEAYKCIIEPKIQIINKRERENVGTALMSFSEKLYLSYPITLARGDNALPCEIIDYFEKIFAIKTYSVEGYKSSGYGATESDVYSYMTKSQGLTSFAKSVNDFAERKIDSVKVASAFLESIKIDRKLYDKALSLINNGVAKSLSRAVTSRLSASIIEKYFACPYACFVNYNLRLKESETGEARALDFGNLLHKILEKFVQQIDFARDEVAVKTLAESLFDEVINCPPYVSFLNKKQYEHIFSIIKTETVNRAIEVFKEYKYSKFKPIGQEVAFGFLAGAKYGAIEIDTAYGKKYISGKVDRIDGYGDYIRIIDYKTGSAEDKIRDLSLYTGTNIQLYLYPQAFLVGDKKLGGIYYYEVNDKYQTESGEVNSYIGKTLCDSDVILATDTRLESALESKKYDIKMEEKGGERRVKNNAKILNSQEIDAYMEYAKSICEVGSEELDSGYISPIPYKDSCKYCKFGGMCGYDCELDMGERKIDKKVTKETILNAIKGGK